VVQELKRTGNNAGLDSLHQKLLNHYSTEMIKEYERPYILLTEATARHLATEKEDNDLFDNFLASLED